MCGKPPAFRDKPFGVSPSFGRGAASPEVGSCRQSRVQPERQSLSAHQAAKPRSILSGLLRWPKTSLWPVSLKNPKAWFFVDCAKQALSS